MYNVHIKTNKKYMILLSRLILFSNCIHHFLMFNHDKINNRGFGSVTFYPTDPDPPEILKREDDDQIF